MNIKLDIELKLGGNNDIISFIDWAMFDVNETHYYITHSVVECNDDNIKYTISMVKPCGAFASSFINAVSVFVNACEASEYINVIE